MTRREREHEVGQARAHPCHEQERESRARLSSYRPSKSAAGPQRDSERGDDPDQVERQMVEIGGRVDTPEAAARCQWVAARKRQPDEPREPQVREADENRYKPDGGATVGNERDQTEDRTRRSEDTHRCRRDRKVHGRQRVDCTLRSAHFEHSGHHQEHG